MAGIPYRQLLLHCTADVCGTVEEAMCHPRKTSPRNPFHGGYIFGIYNISIFHRVCFTGSKSKESR